MASLVAAAVALVLALLTARVDGISMSPTVRDGDALVVDKVGVHLHAPERGDVVVALEPGGAAFVKRVIAVPGDAVQIDGSGPHQVVLIQPGGQGPWRRLEEPYIGDSWNRRESCCDSRGLDTVGAPQPLRVPQDRFFLLGDNRDFSTDSRRYGLFRRDQITGRVLFRWWPLQRAGSIDGRPALAPAS